MSNLWERDGVQVLIAGLLLIAAFRYSEELKGGVRQLLEGAPPAVAVSETTVAAVEPTPRVAKSMPRTEPRRVVLVVPVESPGCRPVPRCH